MTDPEPGRPAPPPSSAPSPPRAPQGSSGGGRREKRYREDDGSTPVLAPHERALIDEAVAPVARRGRGPVIATGLVAAAFLLGLLRPWDLLGAPGAEDGLTGTGALPAQGADASSRGASRTAPPAPVQAVTCAYPRTWRTATIESWGGRQRRVWQAAEVVPAAAPTDPAIRFEPIVAEAVTAIGWCAPVEGPDRPPIATTMTLYRLDDGVASPAAFDQLEPAAPDALGALLVPRPLGVGNRPPWPMGRYVIELRSASGGYVRYLGLELSGGVVSSSPAPGGSPRQDGSPVASPVP